MRILRIIESLDSKKGGPAYSVRESSKMLVDRGHKVTVVTLDHDCRRLDQEVSFEYLRLGPGVGQYGLSFRFLRWLRENVSSYDLVTLHGIWQWPSFCYRLVKPSGQLSLAMPHGSLDVWDRELRPAKFLLKKLYWKIVEKPLFEKMTVCYFTSNAELKAAETQFGLSEVNACTVPYGAVSVCTVRTVPSDNDAVTFGYMGRLHPKKGLDMLLSAFAYVVGAGVDARLRIAGTGDSSYVAELKAHADRVGIGERVEWLGEVSGPRKGEFLASLGLFVLPSHQENFGLAVAEALSAGTPVLISDQVNICGVVSEQSAGIVVPRNVDAFGAAMARWCQGGSSGDWEVSRAQARECFTRFLSLDGFVSSVLDEAERAIGVIN